MEDKFNDSEDFEEHIRMLKETNGSLKQLKGIKTDAEFYRAVNEELSFWRLNTRDMEKFLYNERNIVLELFNRFKDGELKHLSLNNLYDELECLVGHSRTVDYNHRVYSDITGEACEFYNQYERILGDVCEFLDSEIKEKEWIGIIGKMEREYKNYEKKFAQAVDNELANLKKQDEIKPERIRFLERMFVMSGDKAAKVNEKIRDGFLNRKGITVDFLEKEIIRTRAYLDALTSLHLEYSKTTSRINPDYAKFLKYVSDNLDNLELEKAFRKVYGARKK